MSSRKLRRTLVLTLILSAGAFSLPHAEAASARSGSPRAGQSIQTGLFGRSLFEVVKNLFGLLKDALPGPPNGGGSDPNNPPMNREGTGICPHGKPPYPGGM
jgi:hypothetical protein